VNCQKAIEQENLGVPLPQHLSDGSRPVAMAGGAGARPGVPGIADHSQSDGGRTASTKNGCAAN
jgi:hypothetical protein